MSGSLACDQDHVLLGNIWFVNSNNTLDNVRRNSTFASQALVLWQINGTGPLSLGTASQYGWLRVPQAADFFQSFGIGDPSAGPTSAHFELIPVVSLKISVSFLIVWLIDCLHPEPICIESHRVTCRRSFLLDHRGGHLANCSYVLSPVTSHHGVKQRI